MIRRVLIQRIVIGARAGSIGTIRNVQRIDTGFDLQRLLTASFELGTRPATDAAAFLQHAAHRVAQLPGVESVATGRIVPFYFFSRGSFTIPDGRPAEEQPRPLLVNRVSSDFFRTLGIPLVAGRLFDETDRVGSPPVAVVSQALAREFWPASSPVGSCIVLGAADGETCVSVIGIVRDVRFQQLRGEPTQLLYLPAAQDPNGTGATTLFVRTRGEPAALAERVRRAIQALDSRTPFVQVMPLDERARPQRIPWEVAATLFTAFGALATVLAAVGLFMVLAFIVSQRTRELGIRMAIGATRGAIIRLVLGQGVRLIAFGIAAGSIATLALGRLLASRLYGIAASDARTFAGVALLLSAVAVLASWLPALAAARVEPMRVLREE